MNHAASSLKSKTVLGILGGGQLARMSALAASELGVQIRIFCSESETSPAELVVSQTTKGQLSDKEAILKFCEGCDFVTLENEFIDQDILDSIDKHFPDRLYPSSKTFKKIGDKISEKDSFKAAGLKVAPYKRVETINEVLAFAKEHGFPLVLKTAKGGYDGYGNLTLKNESDVSEKFHLLKGELLVEAFIAYQKELAVMVARNRSGEMVVYPIAHTIQEQHICHYVSVPANIPLEIEEKIVEQARLAMTAIDAVGIFAFEFFLSHDHELYLNESAPRPHNSAHYSLEGCVTSQFHNHIRSVLGLPLGKTDLRTPHVLMLNLLGKKNALAELSNASDFLKIADGHLHLYGKKFSKVGRKMGHFTILGDDFKTMLSQLQKLKSEYTL